MEISKISFQFCGNPYEIFFIKIRLENIVEISLENFEEIHLEDFTEIRYSWLPLWSDFGPSVRFGPFVPNGPNLTSVPNFQ